MYNDRNDVDNLDIGQIKIIEASFSWDSLKSAVQNNFSKFNRRQDSRPSLGNKLTSYTSPIKITNNKIAPL